MKMFQSTQVTTVLPWPVEKTVTPWRSISRSIWLRATVVCGNLETHGQRVILLMEEIRLAS